MFKTTVTRAIWFAVVLSTIVACSQNDSTGNVNQLHADTLDNPFAQRNLLIPPTGQTYFGAFTTMDEAQTRLEFEALADMVGKRAAIHMIFRPWPLDQRGNFPSEFASTTEQMGASVMVTWEPWWNYSRQYYPLLRDIADGQHDAYIKEFLEQAARHKRPYFLRFAHEMEQQTYPWTQLFDARQTKTDYINAYVHISRLAKRIAPNTIMVWSPNSGSALAEEYYPGFEHVDWIGASLYNFPSTPQDPNHLDKLKGLMSMVRKFGKPVLISEMGCSEYYSPTSDWDADGDGDYSDHQPWIDTTMADKVRCIDRTFDVIESHYPEIAGLIWFDIDKDADWRLDSSVAALRAFVRRNSDERYIGAR